MDAEALSSARVLHLIRQAQVVDELLQGSPKARVKITEHVVSYVDGEFRRLAGRHTPITPCESLLCDTVLEAQRESYFNHIPGLPPPPKAEEPPLATALKQLVFGICSPGVSIARAMCSQTHEKAGVALRACILAFEDALCPQTCFDVLRIAAAAGNQRLLARSGAVALLHFQQAVMESQHGLSALPLEALVALLSHDLLQADGENAVLAALGSWVLWDEAERLQHFNPLIVRCVRLGCMGQKELVQMDRHPLVPKCERTLKLVAHCYLAVCYGISHPTKLGGIVSSSQRPRLAVKPQALSFLQTADVGAARGERSLQLCEDLSRLSPELPSMPDEAAQALSSTLCQLTTGRSSGVGGAPPSALSSEGLTHAVRSLLCSQNTPQQGNDHSSCGSMLTTEEERNRAHAHRGQLDLGRSCPGLDSACLRKAPALLPPQHESAPCPVSRSECPAQIAECAMGTCSMECDARQWERSSAASAVRSTALYTAELPSGCDGEGSHGEGSGFDIFNTSPSKVYTASELESRHAVACRHMLETGKVPERTGPQRRLF